MIGHGGLIGCNISLISDCYVTGVRITAHGGLVGINYGQIVNCFTNVDVVGTGPVGGLVGTQLWDGVIADCYALGNISGDGTYSDELVGGLVGYNDSATIVNSYARGGATSVYMAGGLVGAIVDGCILDCYSTGKATGNPYYNYTGGLVGDSWHSTIWSSFWDKETSGRSWSDGGIGKTTAQMQMQSTFVDAGWDFVGDAGPSNDWVMPDGGGYPILWWQVYGECPFPSPSAGSGRAEDPYVISDAAGLKNIGHNAELMDKHFKLSSDIDCNAVDFHVIGNGGYPFSGTFDGAGYTISNLMLSPSSGVRHIGVFGYLDGANAEIKAVKVTNVSADMGTTDFVGGLVGKLRNGRISDSTLHAHIISGDDDVGGLVGHSEGRIVNSSANSNVKGRRRVGGLVGMGRQGGIIEGCSALGSVEGETYCGGLVGGDYYGFISDSYALTSVKGRDGVGGLMSTNSDNVVSRCYSAGSVSGSSYLGGLVAQNNGSVSSSFWDVNTSGRTTSAGGTPRTTAEMKTQSTFTSARWDFVGETANGTEDIWAICEGTNYPRLVWQIPTGDIVCPDGVSSIDFSVLARYWHETDCAALDDCEGADIDLSGGVDFGDVAAVAESWLTGM